MNIIQFIRNAVRKSNPLELDLSEKEVERINERLKLSIERERNAERPREIPEQLIRDIFSSDEESRPEVPELRCLQGGGRISPWARPELSLIKPDGSAGSIEDDKGLLRFKGEAPEDTPVSPSCGRRSNESQLEKPGCSLPDVPVNCIDRVEKPERR